MREDWWGRWGGGDKTFLIGSSGDSSRGTQFGDKETEQTKGPVNNSRPYCVGSCYLLTQHINLNRSNENSA